MSLSFIRTDQPVAQGESAPMDSRWVQFLRTLLTEINRIAEKAWNESSSSALQLPSMTEIERDALEAANGMVIYNSTAYVVQAYVDGIWTDL